MQGAFISIYLHGYIYLDVERPSPDETAVPDDLRHLIPAAADTSHHDDLSDFHHVSPTLLNRFERSMQQLMQ